MAMGIEENGFSRNYGGNIDMIYKVVKCDL